jgi:hypothetical protein
LAAVIATVATHAQGQLFFSTFDPAANPPLTAPVELGAVGGAGPGPSYSAALYLVSGGTATLIPGSTTAFRDPNPALAAKFINPVVVTVPGVAVGGAATVQMRAWRTADGSWEATPANFRGSSGDLAIASLGGDNIPPVNLPSSFTGFVIPVPEPSTLALGVLGAAALLLRRRK